MVGMIGVLITLLSVAAVFTGLLSRDSKSKPVKTLALACWFVGLWGIGSTLSLVGMTYYKGPRPLPAEHEYNLLVFALTGLGMFCAPLVSIILGMGVRMGINKLTAPPQQSAG